MGRMHPSMRLKVKADTFFLPDPEGGVYFRNHEGSFRMAGKSIYQWVEKLVPVMNGQVTLAEMTDGLPDAYRKMVYDVAEVLLQRGVVRDVSQDRDHQLPEDICSHYQSQIEFLDTLAGSGAYRFQAYRETAVLAVGRGPFLLSLADALFTSGLPKFHVLPTNAEPTNLKRLRELQRFHRRTHRDATAKLLQPSTDTPLWQEVIQPFDAVLYVSDRTDVTELLALNQACKDAAKLLIPAVIVNGIGIAGPLVHPDATGCFASAWHRLHQPLFKEGGEATGYAPAAGGMLANLIVFELFKTLTGVLDSPLYDQLYLLDLETLEGSWHGFVPHPLVTGHSPVRWLEDAEVKARLAQPSAAPLQDHPGCDCRSKRLLPYFDRLTSEETGILHEWAEGDLAQIPLAQCRVQAVDASGNGPAILLPAIICSGSTHEAARQEAGLCGLEAYVRSLLPSLVVTDLESNSCVGIGAGENFADALRRGLADWIAGAMAENRCGGFTTADIQTLQQVQRSLQQPDADVREVLTKLVVRGFGIRVLDLSVESFLREGITGVFGVVLQKEAAT